MKRSVFFKLFAGYFTLTCVLAGGVFFFSYRISRHYYEKALTADLQKLGHVLLVQVTPLFEKSSIREIQRLAATLGTDIATRITVIDARGAVLADSQKDPSLMENHLMRPEVLQALGGGEGSARRYSATLREDMLYVALPIEKGASVEGVLRVSLFMHDIDRMLEDFVRGISYAGLAIVVLAVCISLAMSRRFTKPIRMLSAAARRISAGDFSARASLKTGDELREFADSFNIMAEKIQGLFRELSLQKEELDNIISSMNECLLLLDRDGRIVLANGAFRQMAGEQKIEGRFFWEIIRVPEFAEIIKSVRARRGRHVEEMPIGEKTYLCSATFIAQKEETLLILLDVSAIKDIERMKKDFVVNVSHELRTPLTAIKGFAETMLEEKTEPSSRRYLEIIKRHTDRLISITKDLMALAQLEREETLDLQPVDLRDLINQVADMHEHRLKEKKLGLSLAVEPALSGLRADPYKFEQLFINLLDNAVKYTEQGTITITARREKGGAVITVADTGIGIAPDQLPRIFERFYVADKSRSRQLGGTGLGLSIAKHIVLQHQGSIDVASAPGAGTTFTIRLPL